MPAEWGPVWGKLQQPTNDDDDESESPTHSTVFPINALAINNNGKPLSLPLAQRSANGPRRPRST